jgi:hypothetical protein
VYLECLKDGWEVNDYECLLYAHARRFSALVEKYARDTEQLVDAVAAWLPKCSVDRSTSAQVIDETPGFCLHKSHTIRSINPFKAWHQPWYTFFILQILVTKRFRHQLLLDTNPV